MSYDLRIYLSSETFPVAEWVALLSSFGETEEQPPDGSGRHWATKLDESCVFTTVRKVTSNFHPFDHDVMGFVRGYKWFLGVYANSGCTPTARWAQFAIPYRCLQELPTAVALDPQTDSFFEIPDEFREFASRTIKQWRGLPQELEQLGLLSSESGLQL